MRLALGQLVVLAATALTVACGGGGGGTTSGGYSGSYPTGPADPTNTTPNSVNATTSNAFDPAALSVSKGTSVTFTFLAVTHNVTFDAVNGAPSNIPNTSAASLARTFSTAGTFSYQCTLHSGMRGTVTVQ